MDNLIAFLERMGRDPSLANLPADELAAAMADAGLDDAPRQALLDRDADALNGLLGGRHKMMCLLFPAEPDGDKQKQGDEPAEDDQPVEDDRKESVRKTGRH